MSETVHGSEGRIKVEKTRSCRACEAGDHECGLTEPAGRVVHECPPYGSGRTRCCDRTPFELPIGDLIAVDVGLVTCTREDRDF